MPVTFLPISFTAAANSFPRRPVMKTYAPSLTNCFAVARPMPLFPPVMRAIFPSSLPMYFSWSAFVVSLRSVTELGHHRLRPPSLGPHAQPRSNRRTSAGPLPASPTASAPLTAAPSPPRASARRARPHAVLVREPAREHVGEDLHVAVSVRPEATSGRHAVVIDDAEGGESHVRGIEVVAERERVAAVERAPVRPAALVSPAHLHDRRPARRAAHGRRRTPDPRLARAGHPAALHRAPPWLGPPPGTRSSACHPPPSAR